MHLAVSTWNYLCAYAHEAKLEQAIGEAVEDGFGVELWLAWTANPEALREARWHEIREMLQGVELSLHTALDTCDEHLFRKEVDMAAFLGADVLVAHEGTLGLELREESAARACCKKALEYARSNGIQVALENGSYEALESALALVDELEICLDVGHAHITDKGIEGFLKRFGSKVCHVHFSDNYGLTDDHLVPGDGYISMKEWRGLLKALERSDFGGKMVFELNTAEPRKSAKRGREFIDYVARSMENEPR